MILDLTIKNNAIFLKKISFKTKQLFDLKIYFRSIKGLYYFIPLKRLKLLVYITQNKVISIKK